ncbi:hypothetical protein KZ686_11555 [Cupriavidus cauae]|uniref:YeeE/YedE family protein n=1 Tax=Cupriavidus cauae TaxID=2608999 RepID=UPI002243F806|nr:hypothetical protein [Cupriavidus cauae]UZN48424.1 hypothetical protein KZ686_11555 [Cupriavidus cauae]
MAQRNGKARPGLLDWNSFTPLASLAGGVIIGIAASMFVLLNGRIAGISGVLGGLLTPVRADVAWRLAFMCGISRLSARSLVATLTFMASGFVTVFVARHLLDP